MRVCALFKRQFTPFLLAPLLSAPIAAATWFVTKAAGMEPVNGQIASAAAFVVFAGVVSMYIVHCMNRYPCDN